MAEPGFEPLTPREALLEIRRQATLISLDTVEAVARFQDEVSRLADAGLDYPNIRGGYELSDQLADRLAQAHKLLGEIQEGTEYAVISGEIAEALALPPDLEAMIERRQTGPSNPST